MKPADKKFKTIEYDLETDFEKIRTVERIVDIIYRDYIERAEEVDKVLRLGNENPTGYTRADIQNLSIVRAEEEFEKGKRQFYKLPEHKRRELIYRYKNYYERQKKKKEKSLATAEKNKTKKRNVDNRAHPLKLITHSVFPPSIVINVPVT